MKRVLIIDDSEQIRGRVAALLTESKKIRIVGQVGNARDALTSFEDLQPDTVILDIRLPDQSGIEILKKIKAMRPKVMVTMLTNFDNTQYREQCRRLGADHFLNKTLEFEKIIDTVLSDV